MYLTMIPNRFQLLKLRTTSILYNFNTSIWNLDIKATDLISCFDDSVKLVGSPFSRWRCQSPSFEAPRGGPRAEDINVTIRAEFIIISLQTYGRNKTRQIAF